MRIHPTPSLIFRPLATPDVRRWLAVFDGDTPEFFAPDERADYASSLERGPAAYEACELEGRVDMELRPQNHSGAIA